jgi:hypothetical protein
MTEAAIEQQPQDVAGAETPAVSPPETPAETTDLDSLLAAYDAGTRQPDVTETTNAAPDPQFQEGELDKLLSELNADTERTNALQSEVDSLKRAEMYRIEAEAFGKYADELQSKLPDHCPPDYARNALLSAAAVNRNLAVAWDNRNMTAAERANAANELRAAEQLFRQVQRMPDTDPRKQAALQQIWQQGARLEMIVQGPALLRRTLLDVEKRARDFQPIDQDATADRAMVAHAVRDSGRRLAPEPPPQWGQMDNHEYRREVRQRYGYDPGT